MKYKMQNWELNWEQNREQEKEEYIEVESK